MYVIDTHIQEIVIRSTHFRNLDESMIKNKNMMNGKQKNNNKMYES